METSASARYVDNVAGLEALFGPVAEASRRKEAAYLHPAYQAMIAASPFAVLATVGPGGLDASPRGDAPGFVAVQDEKTLLLPERRGNNRIDSLRNLMADPRVALLFLIPGIGETLRVNGRARVCVSPEVLERFAHAGAQPKCVLEISVEAVYFQCARAIHRSQLWRPLPEALLRQVPSAGAILHALTEGGIDGARYDRDAATRIPSSLY